MERVLLKIDGMSCDHCVGAVARALGAVSGVEVEQVGIGSAAVAYDPAVVTPERIAEAVQEGGYAVRSVARVS